MQPPTVLRLIFGSLLLFALALHTASDAQTPIVLSAPGEPLVFELAATPDLARHLTPVTTAKLATPAQHAQLGLAYPLWLSDANFTVKTRARQRQSIVLEAKRGNPELSTDLVLALNNNGVRVLEPSTLIFDKLYTFAGAPMPPARQSAPSDLAQAFASALKTTKPIAFAAPMPQLSANPTANQTQVTSTTTVSAPAVPHHVSESISPIHSQAVASSPQNAQVAKKMARAPTVTASSPVSLPASLPASAPVVASSQAIPNKALQASAPTPPPRAAAPIQPKRTPVARTEDWLTDWPLLAGISAGFLLLLYLIFRLLKNRAKSRQTRATLSPTEQAANTIFGLSDEEAEAMRKKWLADQILQKRNN